MIKYVVFVDAYLFNDGIHQPVPYNGQGCFLSSVKMRKDKSENKELDCIWTWVNSQDEWRKFFAKRSQTNDESYNKESPSDDWLIAESLHHLADQLPQAGYLLQIVWLLHEDEHLPLHSNLLMFGALKRLQCWHNAEIACFLLNNDSEAPIQSWIDHLDIEVSTDLVDILQRRTVWRGELSMTDKKNLMNCVLPGFSLVDLGKTQDECVEVKTSNIKEEWITHRSPQMTVVQVVKKNDIPFLYITPECYKLCVMPNSSGVKVSSHFLKSVIESDDGISIIVSLDCQRLSQSMLAPPQCLSTTKWKRQISANPMDFTVPNVELKGSWFSVNFLLCKDNATGCSAFVLLSPTDLNGHVMIGLAEIDNLANKDERKDKQTDKKIPGLDAEKAEKCEDAISEIQLKFFEHWTELHLSPTCWVERQALQSKESYIRKLKRFKSSDRSLGGISAPPVDSKITLDAKEFIKHFRSDGLPLAEELSPIAVISSSGVCTSRPGLERIEDVANASFNEALKYNFHGINYCLDSRNAEYYDEKYQKLESRIIRNETVSTCTIEQVDSPATMAINPTRSSPRKRRVRTPRSKGKLHSRKTIQSPRLAKQSSSTKYEISSKRGSRWQSPRNSKATKKSSSTRITCVTNSEEVIPPSELRTTTVTKKIQPFEKKHPGKQVESRSERHKRKLKYIVDQTLKAKGIGRDNPCYPGSSQRLYSLTKSFVQDLKSSKGLDQQMRNIAESNVDQVLSFEKSRV
ncbi:mdm2-binding protein-like [Anneissia japonica]|uniref:mdm2-binding protein-like n=1 Tax=Anneissia japonica TaxID=1529436 RepID=UPI00142569AF|nr:mdm2-binding protein-like [Anneissia japonica]